jgi:syntaxin 5
MTVKDRTQEFHAAVESLQNRHTGAMHASQLMNRLESRQNLLPQRQPENKSEFARMAAQVGREINATAAKLERLTKRTVLVHIHTLDVVL